jgi:hypothetical protein
MAPGYLISYLTLPVIGSRARIWPDIGAEPDPCIVKSAPMLSCTTGSVIGSVFLISRSMHHSKPTLYSRPVFGLYEPAFQL